VTFTVFFHLSSPHLTSPYIFLHSGSLTLYLSYPYPYPYSYSYPFAALKLCRNKTTRKCIVPRTSVLDPQGVYVIKNPEGFSHLADESKKGNPTVGMGYEEVEQEGGMKCSGEAPLLYLWIGEQFMTWSIV
jgi:hypothetical protein